MVQHLLEEYSKDVGSLMQASPHSMYGFSVMTPSELFLPAPTLMHVVT